MTGEMSQSEVTPEAFPLHFAVAEARGGEVHAFDQYQGPYIFAKVGSAYHRFWICSFRKTSLVQIYDETAGKISPRFHYDDIAAARNYAWDRRHWRKVKQ